jgi:hypothetical protein
MAHCDCCGSNCPWAKKSQLSQKHEAGGAHECPLITAEKPATIVDVQPVATAAWDLAKVLPLLLGYKTADDRPVVRSANMHPSTLLSLSCALTV